MAGVQLAYAGRRHRRRWGTVKHGHDGHLNVLYKYGSSLRGFLWAHLERLCFNWRYARLGIEFRRSVSIGATFIRRSASNTSRLRCLRIEMRSPPYNTEWPARDALDGGAILLAAPIIGTQSRLGVDSLTGEKGESCKRRSRNAAILWSRHTHSTSDARNWLFPGKFPRIGYPSISAATRYNGPHSARSRQVSG